MGNKFNKNKNHSISQKEDNKLTKLYLSKYSSIGIETESVILYYDNIRIHKHYLQLNVDKFINLCIDECIIHKINIILDVTNIIRWSFFDKISEVTIDLQKNKVYCAISNPIFYMESVSYGLDLRIEILDDTLHNCNTIQYLFKKCDQSKFNIIGELNNKTNNKDYRVYNTGMLVLSEIDMMNNVQLYNYVTKMIIEHFNNENFSQLVLPNLLEIIIYHIDISVNSFNTFLDNNKNIHTFSCKRTSNRIVSKYDEYYELFIGNKNIINLTIYQVDMKIVEKLISKNDALEKLFIARTHNSKRITKINKYLQHLSIYTGFFDLNEFETIAQSNLLHVNCHHRLNDNILFTLLKKYPNSIPLASLIENTNNSYWYDDKIKIYANNILKKHRTLEYLLDNNTGLSRMYSDIKN